MYDGPVRASAELSRILSLPRRVVLAGAAEALAEQWTPHLLNDRGRAEWYRVNQLPDSERAAELKRMHDADRTVVKLKPIQAVGLFEAHQYCGLFVQGPVGAGKTLLTWLLPLVLSAKRPLLIVPASVERKTHDEFAELARYWRAPNPPVQVLSYQLLGSPANQFKLCNCSRCTGLPDPATVEGLRPDLLIADECDYLRNPEAAVSKRVARYMARHPETVYCGMTGTALRKSIRNIARHLIWALKFGAPVPLTWIDLEEWSQALDENPRDQIRRKPGALVALATPGYSQARELEAVRNGFGQRLVETPGVIASDVQSCDTPLTVRLLKAPDDPVLDDAFRSFRETQTTLDGWDLGDPLSIWRHATELSCAFFYKWAPRPPMDWIEARRAWKKWVREAIDRGAPNGRPLDSEAQVGQAYPNAPARLRWREIEPTFVPNSVPVPVSASVLGYAVAWLKAHSPAFVWVQHSYIGETLAGMSGVPYFGPKGKTESGRYIGTHPATQSAILSLHANKRGRNLQAWSRNLVLGPPQAATEWEQGIFGRTHRAGQTKPVYVDVLISCAENLYALERAYQEATFVKDSRLHTQKLLIAEYDWTHYPAAELAALPPDHPSRCRWNKAKINLQS
jgi:hypothetical protein